MKARARSRTIAAGAALTAAITALLGAVDQASALDGVRTLERNDVYIQRGSGVTPAQGRAVRREAALLRRRGALVKFVALRRPLTRPRQVANTYRSRLGRRTSLVIVYRAPETSLEPGGPALAWSTPISARQQRAAIDQAVNQIGGGEAGAVARPLMRQLALRTGTRGVPAGGRRLQLDDDPALERLTKILAPIPFPAALVSGERWAIVDPSENPRRRPRVVGVGQAGERLGTASPGDRNADGVVDLLIGGSASGNSLFPPDELVQYDGQRARVLVRASPSLARPDLRSGEEAFQSSWLSVGPAFDDGSMAIDAVIPVGTFRISPNAQVRVRHRWSQARGRYVIESREREPFRPEAR